MVSRGDTLLLRINVIVYSDGDCYMSITHLKAYAVLTRYIGMHNTGMFISPTDLIMITIHLNLTKELSQTATRYISEVYPCRYKPRCCRRQFDWLWVLTAFNHDCI